MKTPPSLLSRIAFRLSVTTLAGIVCAYAGLWWKFESATGNLRDKSLIESAHTISEAVVQDGSGQYRLNLPATVIDAYAGSDGAFGFAVKDRDSGQTMFAAGADTGPIPAKVEEDEDGSLYQYDPDGPGPLTFFGEAFPFHLGDRHLIVQLVRRGSNYQDLFETVMGEAFEEGGWLAGPFLLVLLAVSIATVRGTLAPLRALSYQALAIGPNSIERRLPSSGIPREILPLVNAVNAALDRLEKAFRLEKEFTADAAHELRTPLALLAAQVDTMSDRDAAEALRPDLETMSRLVEQLLRVARVEALVMQSDETADLGAIARNVANYLVPNAIGTDRLLEVDAPEQPVVVHGQSDALFHAVRNLVDNALRHTPPGTAVTLTVTADPPSLSVRDRGRGVPPEHRELIFRRFWRADRRSGGAGLGLAIVAQTMKAHDGSVEVEDAEGGGARFRLVFPALRRTTLPSAPPGQVAATGG